MNYEISVIIPIYRVEKYLDECVQSVLDQTFTDFELILVDDGSPDNCPAMCDNWGEKDARIKVIHKENGGLSDARNAGIDIAKGKYLTFIDSDDFISMDYLEKLYNSIIENNTEVAIGNFLETTEDGKVCVEEKPELPKKIFTGAEVINEYFNHAENATTLVTAWAKLYNKKLFETLRYDKGRINEDEFIFFPLYEKVSRISFIQDIIYFYRQRGDSISGKKVKYNQLVDGYTYWHNRMNAVEIDSDLYKKIAIRYCQWLSGIAFPSIEKSAELTPIMVKEYKTFIKKYIYDRCVSLSLGKRLFYYMSITNPIKISILKEQTRNRIKQ